ncbi:phage major capsid protein [Marinobacter oulmenensis]|uniref:HK97 family phage major capsid protein n=1 Tax=Marinobacter oulmenensis TaxID=643747 RepID=A0A840UFS4_9GAMM|nr:phage major capsid protein [Marinobacter oulmenensis]MBB5322330.1 HK97 family phage major capsid protein [Marinobacter oulmenensis]
MNRSIQALREERTKLAADARKLLDDVEPEEWGSEHNAEYDKLVANIENLDSQIDRHQKQLDIEAANKQSIQDRADINGISTDEAEHQANQEKEIFNTYMRGGMDALSMEQRQMVLAKAREVRGDMSTGTGSEGGYLVPREFSTMMLEALKDFGGMREVANIIRTNSGAGMDWPTTDATSEEGEIVGENGAVTRQDATFGTKSLDTFKFSSKAIAVPFELLQDSAIDLEAHIIARLQQRLGRVTNRMFTTGTGTGQPGGVVGASAAGRVAPTGQTDIVTWEDLLHLKHSVDPAYRNGARFMFHDQTLKHLKMMKDDQSRPLWVPGVAIGEPDTIDGSGYVINQHMPELAAGSKALLYGDFSKYIIRDVMQFMLFRMTDSKYTEKGQVGFLAFMRSGGGLMDVGGAVKHFATAAS